MEHRAPMTPEAAVTISALTTPRSPIVDPLVARLEDSHREIADFETTRRELDTARRLLWILAHREPEGLRVSDAELAYTPGLGSLIVTPCWGGLLIEARP